MITLTKGGNIMKMRVGDTLSKEKALFITEDGQYAIADVSYQVENITVMPAIAEHISSGLDELTQEELQNMIINSLTQLSNDVEEVEVLEGEQDS